MFSHLLITVATGHGRLRVASVLDRHGRHDLERRLRDAVAAGCTHLEVDCGRITKLDGWAVLAIAAAQAEIESQGGSLTITHPSHAYARVARRIGRGDLVSGSPRAVGALVSLPARPTGRARGRRLETTLARRAHPPAEGSPPGGS